MPIYALGDQIPEIHETAYISPEATIIGNVVIGADSSVWPHAVLRADDNYIRIGEGTSIQDGSVLHCTEFHETVVGNFCTIGHLAHLEGCTVHDHALVGSGAIVLHNAVIHSHSLVGAAAMVPGGVEVPPHAMALGVPVKILLDKLPEHHAQMNVESYIGRGRRFRAELRRLD
ncbi:MAG: gamma carbonic anhydrase family protein [Actinobacteria bacterium]|jgi:carbonic anhydrase/acetyltransferase-like protein (isoleucine patch superfamily)|nr:gamma carbonic anhydrase family protein [Actinomycetota bacterium]